MHNGCMRCGSYITLSSPGADRNSKLSRTFLRVGLPMLRLMITDANSLQTPNTTQANNDKLLKYYIVRLTSFDPQEISSFQSGKAS
jgi:hypothetical protein